MAPRVRIEGFDDTEPSPPPAVASTSTSQPRSTSPVPAEGEGKHAQDDGEEDEMDPDTCAICLADIWNKAETSPCHHNLFCFACLHTWCEMSRRCPLCNAQIDFIMTHVRSEHDFQKHYLLPLSSAHPRRPSDPPVYPAAADIDLRTRRQLENRPTHPRLRWGARNTRRVQLEEADENELALQRRKWIYRHKLYAKHVASNAFTRYQSFTPQQFANSADRKSRVVKFARRELQVFPNVDVEWLVTYLLQIMCQLDLRTDNAIRLLSEFLGFEQAEHFAHEVLTFARSPYSDPRQWDLGIQYDRPDCRAASPPPPLRSELPLRRPLSPDHYHHDAKRRRASDLPGHRPPIGGDTYIPDYRRDRPPLRDRSPARRRSYPSPDRGRRGSDTYRPPAPRRSPSPAPPRPRSPSTPPRPPSTAIEPAAGPSKVASTTRLTNGGDRDAISVDDFPSPLPLVESAPVKSVAPQGLKIAGLATAKARRESLQTRLAAERAAAVEREQREKEARLKAQRAKVEAKLRAAQQEAVRNKLMARLEEERKLAQSERGGLAGSGLVVVDVDEEEDEDEAYYGGGGKTWDREEVLRRALEARAAVGRRKVDPRARLLAEMSSVEARLALLRAQMLGATM